MYRVSVVLLPLIVGVLTRTYSIFSSLRDELASVNSHRHLDNDMYTLDMFSVH